MRTATTAFVMLVLLAASSLAVAEDLSKKTVAELGKALDSDSATERDGAEQELLRRGPAVIEPLQDLLTRQPSPEVQVRAERIIAKVFVPTAGRVYHPAPGDKKQSGLQEGDVIFEADGLPIRTRYDMMVAESNNASVFRVYRKGKGVMEVTGLTATGCLRSPSLFEGYLDTVEKTDPAILNALYASATDNTNFADTKIVRETLAPHIQTLSTGHPVLAQLYLADLRVSGELGNPHPETPQRRNVIESLRLAKFQGGNEFSSLVEVPYAAFLCLMNLGECDKALEMLAEAEKRAAQSDDRSVREAFAAIRMECHIASSPLAEATAFWDANAAAMHEACHVTLSDPLGELARRVAAEKGPGEALAFVRKQPRRWLQKTLTAYYEQQSRLAVRADLDKPVRWVRVDTLPRRQQRATTDFFLDADLLTCRTPARIEMTVQVLRVREPGRYVRDIALRLAPANASGFFSLLDLEGTGRFRVQPEPRGQGDYLPTPPHQAVNASHHVVVEIREGGFTISIDGRPFHRVYGDLPKEFRLFTHASGLSAEVRDIRVFAPAGKSLSDEQAAEVAAAWATIDQAFANVDPANTKPAVDILQKHLAGVQSKDALTRLNARLNLLQQIATPEGASLLDKRTLALYMGSYWTAKNQTLVMEDYRLKSTANQHWPVPMQNMELSGLFTISGDGMFDLRLYFNGCNNEFIWFRPSDSAAGFHNVAFSIARDQPTSFVLRVRDRKAVLFIHNGDKPAASCDLDEPTTGYLAFQAKPRDKNDQVTLQQLRLRKLPADTALDSPARMPTAATK